MFKKEISFISDLNLNKLQVFGDRLTIRDINQSKVHPALIKFINSAIDKEIFLDRKKIEVNTVFDYGGDRINNYFSLISEEIKRTQNFDLKFIKQILQDAIVFNVNYLSRPNRTLANFVFGQHEVKAIDEIIINVSHAYYYRYLQKILFTYFEKKKTLLMRRDEFASLLNRIDKISKDTHLEDSLITAINSMANFFNTNSQESEKLPLPAIKFYLQEKRLPEFITKLEEKYGLDESSMVSVVDVTGMVLSVTPETEISIDETRRVEEDLVEDTSENNTLKGEDLHPNSEVIENIEEQVKEVDNSEETGLVDEETEIPNEDILIVEERNDEDFVKVENSADEMEINLNDDIHDEENEIEFEEVDEEEDPSASAEIKEEKKKPEVKTLLRKLINLDKLYDSFIKFPNPFASEQSEEFDLSKISSMISKETNYQIDLSTLAEEIENPRGIITEMGEGNYLPHDVIEEDEEVTRVSLDREITQEEMYPEEKIDEFKSEIKDINDSIDEIVSDDLSEKEFKEEIVDIEVVDADSDEIQSLDNLIDENSLTLNEEEGEEVTEVFSDLTYLDKEEIEEIEEVDSEIIEPENIKEKLEEIDATETDAESEKEIEKFEKFSDMLVSKDMTKIIESLFDYDMEDYHAVINSVSGAANESQAIDFAEEYFRINHIETTSPEVLEFKSLISEYFAKAYF